MAAIAVATEDASRTKPADVPGRFGAYGGRYVPETLMAALEELEEAYALAARGSLRFTRSLTGCCTTTRDGRPRFTLRSG